MKKPWAGAVLMLVAMSCTSFLHAGRQPQHMVPRCPSASKPCRIKAVMSADFLPNGTREVSSLPCSCAQSSHCSDDWIAHRDRVITRKLLTNGNINMTLSMMFCNTIQPTRRCRRGEVALQLSGLTYMPTEVDFINCMCQEHRPLVLHTVSAGSDFRQYQAYVCAKHKDRCRRRRRNPDTCMVSDPETHTVTYPCKCTSRTSCQPLTATQPFRYVCKPPRRG